LLRANIRPVAQTSAIADTRRDALQVVRRRTTAMTPAPHVSAANAERPR
jgi:hypothetical protein